MKHTLWTLGLVSMVGLCPLAQAEDVTLTDRIAANDLRINALADRLDHAEHEIEARMAQAKTLLEKKARLLTKRAEVMASVKAKLVAVMNVRQPMTAAFNTAGTHHGIVAGIEMTKGPYHAIQHGMDEEEGDAGAAQFQAQYAAPWQAQNTAAAGAADALAEQYASSFASDAQAIQTALVETLVGIDNDLASVDKDLATLFSTAF